ncbi:hypothetical protein ACN9MH_15335 [Paenibacillus silvae]|uniref:hypothetical protein n=1 Tax=Paenibacillus silvae TaxID=1325358 RepID=UPI003CF40968
MATWTPIENAKIVGILPEYRSLVKNDETNNSAGRICAQELIDNDKLNIFTDRINKVKYPIDTLAKHIIRMDDIVSGNAIPEHADESNWANCYKY